MMDGPVYRAWGRKRRGREGRGRGINLVTINGEVVGGAASRPVRRPVQRSGPSLQLVKIANQLVSDNETRR